MNAAEITDKLGLHGLRQRAWVCFWTAYYTISQLTNDGLVHPIYLRYVG